MKKKDELSNVLIIHNKDVNHQGLSRLLQSNGFAITSMDEDALPDDLDKYGAIAHIGYSQYSLNKRLGEKLEQIKDEEWLLITEDNEKDLHCIVELTRHASQKLRIFIRTLWSREPVTDSV